MNAIKSYTSEKTSTHENHPSNRIQRTKEKIKTETDSLE